MEGKIIFSESALTQYCELVRRCIAATADWTCWLVTGVSTFIPVDLET
jgi:hypothetical protein